MTRTLTWTFGIRDTYNSNPLNPHDAVARLAGSFDSISHDVNQPLNQVDPDAARERFSPRRRSRSCSREPPSPGRSRRTRCCAAGSACSATSCRAASPIWWARILPTRRPFRAGCWAPWAERRSRRECRTAPSMRPSPRISYSTPASRKASFPAPRRWPIRTPACRRFRSPPFPDGKLHAPYFMQWSFALEHQIGNTLNLRAQYVGTRAVNQPYETQVNGYQTVCAGLLRAVPLRAARRSALRAGHAIEHRREQPLQRPSVDGREAARRTACRSRPTTPGATAWTRSRTADSCRSPRARFFRRCRAIWAANTAPAITTCGTTSRRSTFISCRSNSGTACWRGR